MCKGNLWYDNIFIAMEDYKLFEYQYFIIFKDTFHDLRNPISFSLKYLNFLLVRHVKVINQATSEVTITTSEPSSLEIFDVYGRILIK
jgi:hypothetical protein